MKSYPKASFSNRMLSANQIIANIQSTHHKIIIRRTPYIILEQMGDVVFGKMKLVCEHIERYNLQQLSEIRIAAFCISDEPRSELARAFGDRIQSRNVSLGTSDDFYLKILLIQFFNRTNQCIQPHCQYTQNHNRHQKPIHLKKK